MLEKLGIPKLTGNMLAELQFCASSYKEMITKNDKRINKNKLYKETLSISFEVLSGVFDFPFGTKLYFKKDSIENDDAIYLEGIETMNFDEAFYNLYVLCFKKYLSNLHRFNKDRLDAKHYALAKLAILNNDENIINKLAKECYKEHVEEIFDVEFDKHEWTVGEMQKLMNAHNQRIEKLKNEVMGYDLLLDLSPYAIKNVYKCFSDDIFTRLTIKERIHLANLLYNYFSTYGKQDKYSQYKQLLSRFSNNKEVLSLVIKDLKIAGNTMLVRKKNMDMIKDVLSGLEIVYRNEINKEMIGNLDILYNLKEDLKR